MIETGHTQEELINGFKYLLKTTLKKEISNVYNGDYLTFHEQGINNPSSDVLSLIKRAYTMLGTSTDTQKRIGESIQLVLIDLEMEYSIKGFYQQQAMFYRIQA